MYKELNDKAKEYLLEELKSNFNKKFNSKDLFKRCEKELDILYKKNILFVIEYLYKFKKENKDVLYHFNGSINNLLVLYVLDIIVVNPVEYNLPYILYKDKNINVELVNRSASELIEYLNKQTLEFKIVKGFFVLEEIKEVNDIINNHYLLLPCNYLDSSMLLRFNNLNMLETINDYRDYKDTYVIVRIDNMNNKNNEFENKLIKILKPKTINDYIKIKSISHGAEMWNNNQDKLVKEKKININTLIASREDIFEYLINNNIKEDMALKITNFISVGMQVEDIKVWDKYARIMREENCEEMFIKILSKILYASYRGQAVSEYLINRSDYV